VVEAAVLSQQNSGGGTAVRSTAGGAGGSGRQGGGRGQLQQFSAGLRSVFGGGAHSLRLSIEERAQVNNAC